MCFDGVDGGVSGVDAGWVNPDLDDFSVNNGMGPGGQGPISGDADGDGSISTGDDFANYSGSVSDPNDADGDGVVTPGDDFINYTSPLDSDGDGVITPGDDFANYVSPVEDLAPEPSLPDANPGDGSGVSNDPPPVVPEDDDEDEEDILEINRRRAVESIQRMFQAGDRNKQNLLW